MKIFLYRFALLAALVYAFAATNLGFLFALGVF